ncbi:hypothetical protein X975_26596, partial [Stegodyphus mimosarum]
MSSYMNSCIFTSSICMRFSIHLVLRMCHTFMLIRTLPVSGRHVFTCNQSAVSFPFFLLFPFHCSQQGKFKKCQH